MKVVIDGIVFSLQKAGGISVVWNELLVRFNQMKNCATQLVIYPNKNIFYDESNFFNIDVSVRKLRKFARYLNLRSNCSDKFIFHSTYYRTCSGSNAINVTTIHDFTYEYYYTGIRKYIHCWQKYRAIKKSKGIICISENTKKDLLKFLPSISEDRIKVIYNGVSDDYNVITPSLIKTNSILFVGARSSYKKFEFAVDCISKTDYNLQIIGGGDLSQSEIQMLDSKLPFRYEVFKNISNSELNILYNKAFCLLYPSVYEGFGIPVLEAQKAGCPVIAYRGSSIPEIIGDHGMMFDFFDENVILNLFNRLENTNIRKEIINAGLENASLFTWDRCFNELILFYKELLDEKNL